MVGCLAAWLLLPLAAPLEVADAVGRVTTGPALAAAFQPALLDEPLSLASWFEDDDGDDDSDKEYSPRFHEAPAAARAWTVPVSQAAQASVSVHEIEERSVFRQYLLRNLRI